MPPGRANNRRAIDPTPPNRKSLRDPVMGGLEDWPVADDSSQLSIGAS